MPQSCGGWGFAAGLLPIGTTGHATTMSCAICGKDNQPGTRFCVHCGAALAPVTTSPMMGGAALTSATATAARPAPHGVPTQPMPPGSPAAESKVRPAEPAPSIPAYDSGDRKTGPPYVLIGALALLAIAAAIGYKIFGE
jgi:hypothetical protein